MVVTVFTYVTAWIDPVVIASIPGNREKVLDKLRTDSGAVVTIRPDDNVHFVQGKWEEVDRIRNILALSSGEQDAQETTETNDTEAFAVNDKYSRNGQDSDTSLGRRYKEKFSFPAVRYESECESVLQKSGQRTSSYANDVDSCSSSLLREEGNATSEELQERSLHQFAHSQQTNIPGVELVKDEGRDKFKTTHLNSDANCRTWSLQKRLGVNNDNTDTDSNQLEHAKSDFIKEYKAWPIHKRLRRTIKGHSSQFNRYFDIGEHDKSSPLFNCENDGIPLNLKIISSKENVNKFSSVTGGAKTIDTLELTNKSFHSEPLLGRKDLLSKGSGESNSALNNSSSDSVKNPLKPIHQSDDILTAWPMHLRPKKLLPMHAAINSLIKAKMAKDLITSNMPETASFVAKNSLSEAVDMSLTGSLSKKNSYAANLNKSSQDVQNTSSGAPSSPTGSLSPNDKFPLRASDLMDLAERVRNASSKRLARRAAKSAFFSPEISTMDAANFVPPVKSSLLSVSQNITQSDEQFLGSQTHSNSEITDTSRDLQIVYSDGERTMPTTTALPSASHLHQFDLQRMPTVSPTSYFKTSTNASLCLGMKAMTNNTGNIANFSQNGLNLQLSPSISNQVWPKSKVSGSQPCNELSCLPSFAADTNHLINLGSAGFFEKNATSAAGVDENLTSASSLSLPIRRHSSV